MEDSKSTVPGESAIQGEISLEEIANRKDECVRVLEKLSLDLLCFSYSSSPDHCQEFNRMLEDYLDSVLLDAHKQLAHYRLYGEEPNNRFSKTRLRNLETIVREAEECYERFERAKRENPDPSKIAIVPIFGVEELGSRITQTLQEQENMNKAYENLMDNCKRLLDNSEHMRKMLRSLRDQSQHIFYKQVQVSSLIDETATMLGVCVRDKVADDIHSACLSQAASEFTVDSWLRKIKDCQDTMESIRTESQTYYRQRESNSDSPLPLLSDEERNEIQANIERNTNSILQLLRGAESLRLSLSQDA
ncbi:Nucleoporin complex subunit 54 family protein [Babesia bovis T2Bo]|uniref:Nucleoporin complex subunit 54 family protein n=1 Tax=Babesia bovis T2Bo TaxID=484906 RepID=UPI001DA054A0|nr:Nucleoporin complex subunit 54 family protein [Babesia bovis T2Bo]EDO07284.2 Nucleoporin complex subunit 54 family protein [Babesia bovis T2Bo]